MKFQARPQETVLFGGNATQLKSKLNEKETEFPASNEQLAFA